MFLGKTVNKKVQKKKRSKLPLLFLIVIILGVIFGINVYNNGGGLKGLLITILGQSKKDIEALDTKYVLVLGISEDINVNLTDTIMIASYNPHTQKAAVMSISRDTFVGNNKNSAKATDKLNSVYAQKGIEGVLKKVNNLTGLSISDYVIIKNTALIDFVDAIGGVEFNVPIDMKYDDPTQNLHIDLKQGMQKLDGEKAEWLVRFRHNNDGTSYPASYGDNDIGRMRTQREFIKETLKQTINFKNIFKVRKIVDSLYSNIETNMNKDEILAYASCLPELDITNLESYEFPGIPEKCNSLWFVVSDKNRVEEVMDSLEDYLNTEIEY